MRSIVTVTTPATTDRLTTVARVQADLGIAGSDAEIEIMIDEASSRIQAELGYHLALETVSETFRPEYNYEKASAVLLERTPVVMIDTVTSDITVLDSGEWVVDSLTGLLQRLNGSGMTGDNWLLYNGLTVAYSGGWVMPGEEDRTLPPAIEAAAVAYVGSMWSARQGASMVRAIEIPGVIRREYWTGRATDVGGLPSGVTTMLAPFKRLR